MGPLHHRLFSSSSSSPRARRGNALYILWPRPMCPSHKLQYSDVGNGAIAEKPRITIVYIASISKIGLNLSF